MFIFYFINVLLSCGQSFLCKLYSKKGGDAESFNLNKSAAGLLLFAIIWLLDGADLHVPTLLYGACYGVLFAASMYTGFQTLKTGPMSLSSILASFSLIIPLIFGITVWDEKLSVIDSVGIALLLYAIVMLNIKRSGSVNLKWFIYAFSTLIINGFFSVIQKAHQLRYPSLYQTEFMFSALVTVVLLLFASALFKKRSVKMKLCPTGLAAGIMNTAANYIVLYLAAFENASLLFPIIAVANVIAAWAVGKLAFKERLERTQIIGLIAGIVSIILLKI